jgi:uncharacterized protein YkwD
MPSSLSPTTIVLLALAQPFLAEVVTITTGPVLPTAEPQWIDDRIFTSAILNSTNFYRDEHNASAVAWNATLASFAIAYLRQNDHCAFRHSGGPHGENLAIGYANVTASVEAWGEERDIYDYRRAEFGENTGHFTQLVWKNTTAVGCERRLCEMGWYLVCEYWPRGNVVGQFSSEVDTQIKGDTSVASMPTLSRLLTFSVGLAAIWMAL